MKLTREQVDTIRDLIAGNISIPTLKDDLMDHLWCEVERKMNEKKIFSEALCEVAPRGLPEVQRHTLHLLNSSKTILMKQIMYLIGLLSAVGLSLGWMFSLLQWPGGYQLFNTGFLGFLMLFVPMLALDQYQRKARKSAAEKLKIAIGTSSSLIVGTSAIFKQLHLQGADVILVTGVLTFTFGFLPFLFFAMYKKATSKPVSYVD